MLKLTMAHRSLSRQEPVRPKKVQALCRGHPWSLARYQLSPRRSGFASGSQGRDWLKSWMVAWSAFNAGTWIQLQPHWEETEGHEVEIEYRIERVPEAMR